VPYRNIEDAVKLRRVLQATLLIESDLTLPAVLRHVVEEARSMTGARYGALGVLNAERDGLREFITVGLELDEEERIGNRPTGLGVLGLLIADPRPIRVTSIAAHPKSSGFPANHPPMASFLGVPIMVRDEVYGNLYLTDKSGWSEFTHDDEILVEALALSAGIAIENADLHQRVQEVAVYEDRDRMARDLHDLVIQRLFGVGLSLQSMVASVSADRAERLESAVVEIDDVIRQIRSTIYELGSPDSKKGLREQVIRLVGGLTSTIGFEVNVSFVGPVDVAVPYDVAENILATIREAVSNIGRHAAATRANVKLSVNSESCRLDIVDNGKGFDATKQFVEGLGLSNLRHRAEKFNGLLLIDSSSSNGTALSWQVPLSA
jgi:signal transduction histidine kinase